MGISANPGREISHKRHKSHKMFVLFVPLCGRFHFFRIRIRATKCRREESVKNP